MYRVRWDRLFAVLTLLALPLLWHWLKKHISIGNLSDWPVLDGICQSVEVKGLILLAILLAGLLILIKVLLKD